MTAQTTEVRESTGRMLSCTIFRPSGRKLFVKGHVLRQCDVRLIETEGLGQAWVTELEDGEVGEYQAVSIVAPDVGCGSLKTSMAPVGRADLFTTEDCCVLVDTSLLNHINCIASIAIATIPNFSFATA